MKENIEKKLMQFMKMFNEERDYIECHHISRSMLLEGEERELAKFLATLSGLAEQAAKGKLRGYRKFQNMIFQQMADLKENPFDEQDLRQQLDQLDKAMPSEEKEITPHDLEKLPKIVVKRDTKRF